MNGNRAVSWAQALTEMGVILRLDAIEAEGMLEAACEAVPSRCRRCGCDKLYKLSGGRLRCAKCRYSFYTTTGRWLGRHRLPAKVWLAAIKAFELGLGPGALAQLCELSLPTAAELEKTIQMSLASMDPEWAHAVRAVDQGENVPRAFRARAKGQGFTVLPCEDGEPGVDVPAEGPESMRAFRMGVRRWMKLPADRFALKLKEWQVRSTHPGSLFQLSLEALVRYMPAGISERKGGVTARAEVRGEQLVIRSTRSPRATEAVAA